MPKGKVKNIIKPFRFFEFFRLPAVLWGIIILPVVLYYSRFVDKIIFTSPPESLIFSAWICQLFGKSVYLDLRDQINRPSQRNKWLIPVYDFFYKRLKNVCVTMKCFDPNKTLVRHGYDDITKIDESMKDCSMPSKCTYKEYNNMLAHGCSRHYSKGFEHYTSSSIVTLRKLGNAVTGKENLHPELFNFKVTSWKSQALKMEKFLEKQ